MSPEDMYLWMAGVHGAKTPLWLGVPAEKSGGSFLDSGTAASSGRENKGTLGKKCGTIPRELLLRGLLCIPPSFCVASSEGKRGLRDWNLWR